MNLFATIFVAISISTTQATWWNLALNQNLLENSFKATENTDEIITYCNSFRQSLSPGQVKVCQYYVDHMTYVARGAKLAIVECQHQFRNEQWNCSIVSNQTVYGNSIAQVAARETAFIHAISAAGVLQAISRSCRNGDLHSCGCSKSKRPQSLSKDWVWGGCGDNIEYGYKFTKDFIDLVDRATNINLKKSASAIQINDIVARSEMRKMKARRLMNLHNNEAGRRAVYKFAKVECKCVGLSGSCTLKTCWLKLASFREVGDMLKEKYDSAIEVKYESKQNQLRIRHKRFAKPTKQDLIYIDESPNYCATNPKMNILGTQGRQCNKNSYGSDSCKVMCCGRGYQVKKTIKQEKCKCKFQWCCSVKCETCITEIETYICK